MNKINILIIIVILFFVFRCSCSCNKKENFADKKKINSICRKKHLDAYKNCILNDFTMYNRQSRQWNQKWDKDCQDNDDLKCELLKEKSKKECKIAKDDDFFVEFDKLQKKKPYIDSDCFKPDLMNPTIINDINKIDTEIIDNDDNIKKNGSQNRTELDKLYIKVINKMKKDIDDIDKSKEDNN